MKKILATILAFIYLSTSMGATLHLHYCMGKLISWGFVNQNNQDCRICGKQKEAASQHCGSVKTGCCKDEAKQIKTGTDQKIGSADLQIVRLSLQAPAGSHLLFADFIRPFFTKSYSGSNAPPNIGKAAVFLLNRNFRI